MSPEALAELLAQASNPSNDIFHHLPDPLDPWGPEAEKYKHLHLPSGKPDQEEELSSADHDFLTTCGTGLILFQTQLSNGANSITADALLDCGASGNFMDAALLQEIPPLSFQPQQQRIQLPKGLSVTSTGQAVLAVSLNSFHCKLSATAIPELGYDLILGRPWLAAHGPVVNWRSGQMTTREGGRKHEVNPIEGSPRSVALTAIPGLETLTPSQVERELKKPGTQHLGLRSAQSFGRSSYTKEKPE
ncbi:hypothetical protein KEM55_002685 [Ascosphaera atra]|nr:hypothetical protein KEM55_002685 [Ascosphaera atra]